MLKMSGVVFLIFSLLVFVGCQAEAEIPEGYYVYEKDQVEEAVQQVSFNPALPEYLPIPVEFIISDPYYITGTAEGALDISFYSGENDLLTYQATEGRFDPNPEAEQITIDKTTNGYYYDNGFAKILIWERNDLSYKLEFRSSIIGEDQPSRPITKHELVQVARSCHYS